MKNQHTLGPWYCTSKAIFGNNGGTFICENPSVKWEALAALTKNQGSAEIEENIKQAKANAKLMASAPDLLSALNLLLDKIHVHAPKLVGNAHTASAIEKAEMAISKAKGLK